MKSSFSLIAHLNQSNTLTSVPNLCFNFSLILKNRYLICEFYSYSGTHIVIWTFHITIDVNLKLIYLYRKRKLDLPTPASPVRITTFKTNVKELTSIFIINNLIPLLKIVQSYFYRNDRSVQYRNDLCTTLDEDRLSDAWPSLGPSNFHEKLLSVPLF